MNTLYEDRYNFKFFYRHHNHVGAPSDKYHFHDDYEIYISCMDSGYFYVNGEKTPLHYGDVYFFSSTDMHKVYIEKNVRYERYVIMFDCAFVRDLSTPETNLLHVFDQDRPVKKLCRSDYNFAQVFPQLLSRLDEIERCYQALHDYGNDVDLKLRFTEFLLYLNRLYIKAYPESMPRVRTSPYAVENHDKVREVIHYIQTRYQEPLSLDLLADTFFVSKTNLNKLFRQYVGMSTKQYIINIRLSHAKYLLKQGMSVQDTCGLCGFNDYTHFIRAFTASVGISPKQYALTGTEPRGSQLP